MKSYYLASLCKNGLLGGGLVADETALHYHTNKLTVPPETRHIIMPYEEMLRVVPGRLLCFATLSFSMKDGKTWKYVVFGRRKLLERLQGHSVTISQ